MTGDPFFGAGTDQVAYYATRTINLTVHSGQFVNPTMVHTPTDTAQGWYWDPHGWLQSGSLAAEDDWFGVGMAPYTWLMLPPGLYLSSAFVYWNDAITTGFSQVIGVDSRDISLDTADLDPWAGNPAYAVGGAYMNTTVSVPTLFAAGGLRYHNSVTLPRVIEATGPQAMSVLYVKQDSGSDQVLSQAVVTLVRIGAGGA
jgi:hypothetical protein